jgi:hypothetical protein
LAQTGHLKVGRACPLCPGISDINLFRYRQSVIDFNAEIPDRAFDFGMPEQKLNSSEVARPSIDQGRFGSAQGMCPEQPRVETDAADPLGDEASILAGCHATGRAAMSGEQEFARSFTGGLYIIIDRLAGLLAQFKSDRAPGLLLPHRRTIRCVSACGDVLDPNGDDITAPKLAVDCQIEHGEIANPALNLKLCPDRPDVFGS